jgi:hypothetical protein
MEEEILKKFFKAFMECAVRFQLLGLQEVARNFVELLEKDGLKEKLKEVDFTETEEIPYNDMYNLIVVKACPFYYLKKSVQDNKGWSEEAKKITFNYNIFPEAGGGAFDPICIIHRLVRREVASDSIVQLGCASGNEVILSKKELNKLGMDAKKAEELLKGNACLYALKK